MFSQAQTYLAASGGRWFVGGQISFALNDRETKDLNSKNEALEELKRWIVLLIFALRHHLMPLGVCSPPLI